jgi:hypothetical protein
MSIDIDISALQTSYMYDLELNADHGDHHLSTYTVGQQVPTDPDAQGRKAQYRNGPPLRHQPPALYLLLGIRGLQLSKPKF